MRHPHLVIQHGQVELHFPHILRLKLPDLEIDRHQAAQGTVVKQQVDHELAVPDIQALLAANEAKYSSHFLQEGLNFGQNRLL